MASNHVEGSWKQAANTDELIALAKSALAETEEKQLAALDGHAQLPFGYGTQPGDTLDLSDKGVQVLPIELINLIRDRVERLSLGHNRLTEVPADIIFCSNLLYLNLRHNKLDAFPEPVLHLRKLQILDLSHNSINSVPEDVGLMFSLMFLAIESNQIRRLPVCMGEMSRLQKLKLGANPMEFPPPEVFIPNPLGAADNGMPIEEARQICSQVKLYLREHKQREFLSTPTSEINETSLETPRPPRRSVSGRFPVRPSMSGIDGLENLRIGEGSGHRPPAPAPLSLRNRARDSVSSSRRSERSGAGPLSADGGNNRSRSETVTSNGSRNKRLGYVPRKISGASNITITESGTLKPLHHRGASSMSLAVHSGNESSSGAVSPIDGPVSRMPMARRRLSSLPEDRRVSRPSSMTVRIASRIVFSLYQLNGSIGDAVRIVKSGSPRKTTMERVFFEASATLEELDRRLSQVATTTGESRASEHDPWIQAIRRKCGHVLQAYAALAAELRLHARKVALRGEGMYIRNLMLHIYGALLEIRNTLSFQASEVKTPARSARTSLAGISRSTTPTQIQTKSLAPKKRLRAATILQPSKLTTPGAPPPPVPLITSRTNTMSSMSAAHTPRSGESFSSASGIPRSVAPQPTAEDSEEQRQFEAIYLKLQYACDLAAQTLPGCRVDFYSRKEATARSMQATLSRLWTIALAKCDTAINALEAMRSRLSMVKLKDPGLRSQRDFWQLCDKFVRTWLDLALEIKNIGGQGYDTDSVKIVMRPVQKAVKDVSIAVNGSQLYQTALRSNSVSGYVTPVPATPLSAALGPAAQATVSSAPRSTMSAAEYHSSGSISDAPIAPPMLRNYSRGR